MNRSKVVHPCCESIAGRHQSTCHIYTPTGKRKLTAMQADILVRAAQPGCESGLRLNGRGSDSSAYALQRRGLARLYDNNPSHTQGRVVLTDEGRRLAELLAHQNGVAG